LAPGSWTGMLGAMIRLAEVGLRYAAPALTGQPGPVPDALRDLSCILPTGSFHWLLGPSGAGKSSLLALLHLALRPSRGELEIFGHRIRETPRAALPALRRRIGMVPQDSRLLPYLTVFDNVALPLRLAGVAEAQIRADVTEMLDWVGLATKTMTLPAALSGGEQQRAALARAVVARPALLLADEPTGNLDLPQARRVLALLREMHRLGTTIVVATHAATLIEEYPAPALYLQEGALIAHG